MANKYSDNIIFNNTMEISEAFNHNEDSGQSASERTIKVREVIWTWTKSSRSEYFGECHARRQHFFPGDIVSIVCDSIADPHEGTSSVLSAAFQMFKFDASENCLVVTGKRNLDRPYRVEIFFL